MNTIRVSNSLDPDQARWNVGPDLGPNSLQKLSADDTRGPKSKEIHAHLRTIYFVFVSESLLCV